MTQTVTIDPVTRIEGHGKITLVVDDEGRVVDARFHVIEFRGFEKFCEGRPFWEMPDITSRVCGICPVSHMLASAKAGDAILGVKIPDAAVRLRRLIHYAQLVQSHALSFFHLSLPDLLLGMDADPAQRNIMALAQSHPSAVRNGIRLRHVGQEIIRLLAGKSIHPVWAVPGGVRSPLGPELLHPMGQMLPEALEITEWALELLKQRSAVFKDEEEHFGNFPSLFLALVTPEGGLEHYDGLLRMVDAEGNILEDGVSPERYAEIIGESVQPWSYLKFPYYRPGGTEGGIYRVGPLARLNVCEFVGTPRAEKEYELFRERGRRGGIVWGSFHMHHARLIEILYALERIAELITDPALTDTGVRSRAGVNNHTGIGVIEAPRGTLIHDYRVDGDGLMEGVNLIVASGHNNAAMNRTILDIARAYVQGAAVREDALNRIEHGIRLYDPCLSCSTHCLGRDGRLSVEIVRAEGLAGWESVGAPIA